MRPDDRLAELLARWQAADERGEPVDPELLCRDDPDLLPALRQRIEFVRRMAELAAAVATPPLTGPKTVREATAAPHDDLSATSPEVVPAPGPVDLPPGYERLQELGRGGMGVVFLARHTASDRLVAVKMLLAGSWAGAEELARFRAEARAAAGITHPNVVAVYDVGDHAGLPYFSFEYCPAGSLRDRLRDDPLPPADAAALSRDVAAGVAAAHAGGVVHRDLKPQNVLFQRPHSDVPNSQSNTSQPGTGDGGLGIPKVADFGLAKGGGDDRLTATGSFLGTPAYMAPEQARGQARHVGPPADVWALGAILYECLTGHPPFRGPSMVETLDLVRTADPVAPRLVNPAIPRDLETVCLKCLRKESAQRYPTAGELAADLDRFLAGLPVVARPVGRAEKAWKWARRNPRVAGLLAALAAVIVLALGTTTYLWRQARDRERDAHQQRELADASRIRAELSETATLAAFYEAKVARAQAAAGEQRARTEATRAEGVAEFLGGLFEASDPLQISGTTAAIPRLRSEQLTAREMLLRGAEQLDQQSDLSPDARATLALRIGNSFLTIGDFLNAAKYLGVAKAGLEAILPPDHPDLAEVYHALAWLEQLRGNYDEAEPLYRRAAALQATLDQADPRNAMLLTTTWIKLGILLAEMGDTVPAAQLVEQARVRRAELAKADARYNRALGEAYLAAAVVAAEDGGLPALRKVQTFSEQGIGLLLGRGDDKLARAIHLFQEGLVLAYVQRRPQEAIGKLNECLELTQRVLGDRHLYSLIVRGQLAFVQDDFGDTAAAERNFRECLAIGKEQQVLTHPKAGRAFVRLARLLARTNRADEARAVLADWLGEHEKSNPDSLKHADALTDAAAVYIDLGDDAGGVKALGRAEAIYRTKLKGGRRTDFVSNQSQLAAAYSRQENWAAAEPRFAAALTAIDDHFPDDRSDDDYFKLIAGWSRSQVRLGRYPPEVETRLVEARAALAKDSKRRNRFALRTTLAVRLSEYYRGRGDPEKAIAVTREAAHEAVTGESLFAVAEELALCSDLAKGTESERLMAEAVKALRTAVRRGGVDANRIRATKAFTRLHDRTDFQELLDELSQPPP